jgi:hypoxanthine phosphoribosyltransferase
MEGNELLSRAIELISKAGELGMQVRLFGGLAVAYLAPNGMAVPALGRAPNDIDLFTIRRHAARLSAFLEKNGAQPDRRFNALHGFMRQQYLYKGTKIDLLIDEFRMCHTIQLKDRLGISGTTIPPSDLLLTKLQVVEINEKDMKDVLALLHDLKIGNSDTHTSIDAGYISEILANDWGFYRTVTANIEKISVFLATLDLGKRDKIKIGGELEYLRNAIELKPKSVRWKLRSRIGDKVRWYETPEEVAANAPAETLEVRERYAWVSLTEMKALAGKMAGRIMKVYGKPQAILYIERGGMVLARMLADSLNVVELFGVQMVAYEDINRIGKVYVLPHYITLDLRKGGYVLLVDDIADTGKTLSAAAEMFRKKFGKVVTATLAYKPKSSFKPDVIGKTVPSGTWLVFDYEEEESLNSFRKRKSEEGVSFIEKTAKRRQSGFDAVKAGTKRLAERIEEKGGAPAAILYPKHSGLIIARLLSDYLSVKRVLSIIPDKYESGSYAGFVADACAEALRESPNGYVLLVDEGEERILYIKEKMKRAMPGMRILTAALASRSRRVDFTA